MKFKFLEDIATADIAFEAFGKTYSELFENAGLAVEETMVSTKTVEPKIKKTFKKEESSLEDLLFSFLEELVYLKDAEGLVFGKIKCEVKKVDGERWTVGSELWGNKINLDKHELRDDVKAVTKHMFEVKQLPDKNFRCQVVLDV